MEAWVVKAEKHEVGFGLEKYGLDFKRWYHSVWLGKHATLNKNRTKNFSEKMYIIHISRVVLLTTLKHK